jgi:hypothetical protein
VFFFGVALVGSALCEVSSTRLWSHVRADHVPSKAAIHWQFVHRICVIKPTSPIKIMPTPDLKQQSVPVLYGTGTTSYLQPGAALRCAAPGAGIVGALLFLTIRNESRGNANRYDLIGIVCPGSKTLFLSSLCGSESSVAVRGTTWKNSSGPPQRRQQRYAANTVR